MSSDVSFSINVSQRDLSYSFFCNPCAQRKRTSEANTFCVSCDENLCTACRRVHSEFFKTKHHEMIRIHDDLAICAGADVDMKIKCDKRAVSIVGCDIQSNGHVIMADQSNNKIKILDTSYTIVNHISLNVKGVMEHGELRSVAHIAPNHLCVTLAGSSNTQCRNALLFLNLKTKRCQFRYLDTAVRCSGVTCCGDRMYVTSHSDWHDPGGNRRGALQVLSTDGNLLATWEYDDKGRRIFSMPVCVATSPQGDSIHVGDWTRGVVTLANTGDVMWTFSDPDLKCPSAVSLDGADNVFVCGWLSDNVMMLSPGGQKLRVLLAKAHGIKRPVTLCYDQVRQTLLVGMERSQTVKVFTMRV